MNLQRQWQKHYKTLRDPARRCSLLCDMSLLTASQADLDAMIDKPLHVPEPKGTTAYRSDTKLGTVLFPAPVPQPPPPQPPKLVKDLQLKTTRGDGVFYAYVRSRSVYTFPLIY